VKYMLSLWLSFFGKEEFLEYLRTILGINIEQRNGVGITHTIRIIF
jgi:hypothetical protein